MKYTHTFAVCAYKESPYLEECIISLLNQRIASNIIIVTSTPNDYIRKIAEKYKLSYRVNEGEGGITQDWNFGYKCADTEYITIAHQDDIYEPEYASIAIKFLKDSNKPLIFFSDYYEIRNGRKVERNKLLVVKRILLAPLRLKLLGKYRWVRRRILSLGSPICCPSVTFAADNLPKEVFKHGFRACEDWEAWEMISKLKGDFLYSSKLLVGHRIHEGSETSAIIGDNKRTQEEYKMYCKFWPAWFAKMLVKVYAIGQQSNQL